MLFLSLERIYSKEGNLYITYDIYFLHLGCLRLIY